MIAYRRSGDLDPNYPMLEHRPEKPLDPIPYIKGHNVRADDIESYYEVWEFTLKQIVESTGIEEEKVKQALKWCEEHRDLVDKVNDEERRRLGIK